MGGGALLSSETPHRRGALPAAESGQRACSERRAGPAGSQRQLPERRARPQQQHQPGLQQRGRGHRGSQQRDGDAEVGPSKDPLPEGRCIGWVA
jgi:hypothetical protein